MKKASAKRRRSIDFSKGVRGKYAGVKLIIVGETQDSERKPKGIENDADAVLNKVLRVLKSPGSSKRELEAAIGRARDLIESVRHP
jgi:hypothetical protein